MVFGNMYIRSRGTLRSRCRPLRGNVDDDLLVHGTALVKESLRANVGLQAAKGYPAVG
jgi:hypothetical protein